MAKIVKVPAVPIKEGTSVRQVEAAPPVSHNFEYNNFRELEYKKYDQVIPDKIKGSQENVFLSRVDITKGPIARQVTQIIRSVWRNHESPQKENRDTLFYYENWHGKDWQGNIIPPVTDHLVGVYTSLVRVPVTSQGRITGYKTQDGPVIHYIPFTKDKVDEIIENSEEVELDQPIQFKIRTKTLRLPVESYEDFVNYSFKELESIARRPAYSAQK